MSRTLVTQTRLRTTAEASHTALQPHPRASRAPLALAALLFALGVALLATPSAFGISRNEVLSRAQRRIDAPVPYSQAKTYAGYRTDCSGYVSMCWATGTSWSTSSFYNVTHRIPTYQLAPGDALLKKGYHIRLFVAWLDDAHTQYVSYESANGRIAGCRIHSIAEDLAFGYVPTRYDRITSSPKSRNLLQNGSFNTWARSWGDNPDQPVWWQTAGSWYQTLAYRRMDTYRTARNSLKLVNSSEDTATFTELSQSVAIVPGADYRVTAWAKSGYDARGLELKLVYLNASGQSVAETSTAGTRTGINATSWRWMSVLAPAPRDAARATVVIRLAGGGAKDASGTVTVPGTSVLLDDISLVRPQVSLGITSSSSTASTGKTVVLRGTVTPASAIGKPAVVYVMRPGGAWMVLGTTQVYSSDGAGAWKRSFTFTRSMPRGVYRFKTAVSSFPGWIGAYSSTVNVTLR